MATWEAPSNSCHAALFPHFFPAHFPLTSASSTSSASSISPNQMPEAMLHSGFCTPMMQSPAFPGGSFECSETKPDIGSEKKRSRIGIRRYKTPSPQILRQRRGQANERERRRMTTLNTAYDRLRTVLPDCDSGRKLSKFDTLRMAQEYIAHLDKILRGPAVGSRKESKRASQ